MKVNTRHFWAEKMYHEDSQQGSILNAPDISATAKEALDICVAAKEAFYVF